jgi:hypothetical protein
MTTGIKTKNCCVSVLTSLTSRKDRIARKRMSRPGPHWGRSCPVTAAVPMAVKVSATTMRPVRFKPRVCCSRNCVSDRKRIAVKQMGITSEGLRVFTESPPQDSLEER